MKSRLVLLLTHDRNFERLLAEALLNHGSVGLIARNVGDALQNICARGRAFDFAVIDFDDGCRGMTLLGAINTCHPELQSSS